MKPRRVIYWMSVAVLVVELAVLGWLTWALWVAVGSILPDPFVGGSVGSAAANYLIPAVFFGTPLLIVARLGTIGIWSRWQRIGWVSRVLSILVVLCNVSILGFVVWLNVGQAPVDGVVSPAWQIAAAAVFLAGSVALAGSGWADQTGPVIDRRSLVVLGCLIGVVAVGTIGFLTAYRVIACSAFRMNQGEWSDYGRRLGIGHRIARCGTFRGMTRQEIEARLGRESPPNNPVLTYDIGGSGFTVEFLTFHFDRNGRMTHTTFEYD